MMKNLEMTPWKLWFGIVYGAIIASAYLFIRTHTHDGGVLLFGTMAGCAFLIHFSIWPKLTLKGLLDWQMCFRGLLYGVTQMLIFKAQSAGLTSTALVASTMGSVFGVILGRLILKEKIQGLGFVAAIFCFAAVFLNPLLVITSHWGMIGGFTQGLGFVLARSLMIEKKSIRQSISTGFFVSAVVTVIFLLVTGSPIAITKINLHDLTLVLLLGLVIQYGFFYLYKILDAQRASLILLSRLPWAISLEHFLVGSALVLSQIISSALIAVGAAFLLLEANTTRSKGQKSTKR